MNSASDPADRTAVVRRYSLEGCVSAILMGCLLLTVTLQVVGRSAGGIGPVWSEELARWIWIWMVYIGLSEVERQRGNLRMDAVLSMLPRKLATGMQAAIDVTFALILIHLVQIGIAMTIRTSGYAAVALPVPTAWLYAAFPIGGVLILGRVLWRLTDVVRGRDPYALGEDHLS